MKTNRLDEVTDMIKKCLNGAIGEVQKQFKNTNPYRQEKVDDKERLFKYSQMTQQQLDFYASQFGAEVVQRYINEMAKLQRRYQNA